MSAAIGGRRRRIRRSRVLAVAFGAVLAMALSACVTIPTGGGVATERIPEGQNNDDTVRVPLGPENGMTPEEIVAGFVRAGGGPQNNYDVAHQYLADSFTKWKPSAGITLSDSQVVPVASDTTGGYTVSLGVVGRIDPSGVYTAQSEARRDLSFHVIKERGQWRIDKAPDGTVLSTRDLGGAVKPYDLYFFDPDYDYLVPDLRWFADQGGPGYVPGRIVSALLAGPAPWLASPVLVSAFPSGTERGDTPTQDAGTMTVDLSSAVLGANAQQQQRMLQQLTLSLRAYDVSAVTMTVNGLSVPVTGQSTADSAPSVQYDAIGSDGKTFGVIGADGVSVLPQLGAVVQSLAPTAASLARDRTAVAVRGTGGVSLVTGNGHAVIDNRPALVGPTIDPLGYVWSAQSAPDSLIAVRTDGKPHPMPITADGSIVSLSASRDGTRLLVGLQTDTGPSVEVLGIQRDKDGVPTGFGTPLVLPLSQTGPVIGAEWIDEGSVAVLTGVSGEADAVFEYELAGRVTDHGTVRDAVALAAGSGGSGFYAMRVLTRGGDLLQPSVVEAWQTTGQNASLLGVQQ